MHIFKPESKPDDLTDRQYECLQEIYSSPIYMNNLSLMRLTLLKDSDVYIISKDRTGSEVNEVLDHLELNRYRSYLDKILKDVSQN